MNIIMGFIAGTLIATILTWHYKRVIKLRNVIHHEREHKAYCRGLDAGYSLGMDHGKHTLGEDEYVRIQKMNGVE